MFKVDDDSEALVADRDGSRGQISTPAAVHEQAILQKLRLSALIHS